MMLMIAATVCFTLHAVVGGIDGVYFHLHKYKLYTRPECVVEHFTHTLRAGTMAIAALLFFAFDVGGWLLWLGLLLIVLDLVIETWDVLIERRSRAHLGGLSSAEYLAHAHAILLYAASYALVIAAKPHGAFALDGPLLLGGYPAAIRYIGWAIAIGATLSTIQHVVYLHPRYRTTAAHAAS